MKKNPALVELAVIAYCLWQAIDVIPSWFNTPFQKLGWIAFCLWILPVLVYWSFPTPHKDKRTTPLFLWIGLFLSLAGTLGSLNALNNLGLAVALLGLLPWSWPLLIWCATAMTWMPATAYFARSLSIPTVIGARLVIAICGMAIAFWALRHEIKFSKTMSSD